ncbi:MAG: FAD-dependent oxidoreductase [Syntrophomonadaceae bacterium]|nr:FAD-dependent oxidoreductase [Syntrophomonadaceae bacterium]
MIIVSAKRSRFITPPSPYWIKSTPETSFPELGEDIQTDIAIVGGGIVGLTAAYLLAKHNLKIVVLEAGRILQGTTGHTTAKITSQHSLIYARLKNQLGEEPARQYAEANENAIKFIADTVQENQIDCDFQWRSAYVYTQSDQYIKQIEDENQAAVSFGIKSTVSGNCPLPFPVKAALRFDHQAQFHPLKYLKSLVRLLPESCRIFEHTRAVNIEGEQIPTIITGQGRRVSAAKVIIASHYPFFDGGGLYFARVYPTRSYITGITITEKFPEGMYISAESPARSLRSTPFHDNELILIGGENHKTGQSANTSIHYDNLLTFAGDTFQVQDTLFRWSTQDYTTLDGIPYVGLLTFNHPRLYTATGFGKWGMTNGTNAAIIIKDLIISGNNSYAKVFSPLRFTPKASAATFVTENANVAKHFLLGKLSPALAEQNIPAGDARIINHEGEKLGVFKDDNNRLHIVDVICPHVGCELSWNEAERSWDCPCHGSRFTYEGDIIEGPALSHLHHPGEGQNQVEPNVFPTPE